LELYDLVVIGCVVGVWLTLEGGCAPRTRLWWNLARHKILPEQQLADLI
jgi:hypothetical protein